MKQKIKIYIKSLFFALRDVFLTVISPLENLAPDQLLMRKMYMQHLLIEGLVLLLCVFTSVFLGIIQPVLIFILSTLVIMFYIAWVEIKYQNGEYRFVYSTCENISPAGMLNRKSDRYQFSVVTDTEEKISYYLTSNKNDGYVIGQTYIMCFREDEQASLGDANFVIGAPWQGPIKNEFAKEEQIHVIAKQKDTQNDDVTINMDEQNTEEVDEYLFDEVMDMQAQEEPQTAEKSGEPSTLRFVVKDGIAEDGDA